MSYETGFSMKDILKGDLAARMRVTNATQQLLLNIKTEEELITALGLMLVATCRRDFVGMADVSSSAIALAMTAKLMDADVARHAMKKEQGQ